MNNVLHSVCIVYLLGFNPNQNPYKSFWFLAGRETKMYRRKRGFIICLYYWSRSHLFSFTVETDLVFYFFDPFMIFWAVIDEYLIYCMNSELNQGLKSLCLIIVMWLRFVSGGIHVIFKCLEVWKHVIKTLVYQLSNFICLLI